MRERERREGAARMGGGAGAPGRASQGQAELGRVGSRRGSKSHDTHNH
jgi:hypothetical protein